MNLPAKYSYNPRLRLIFGAAGAGLIWIILQRLECKRMPHGFSLWFGLLPIMLGLLLGARRLAVYRSLLLNRDELVLPTGLFQRRITKIPYVSIKRVWRIYLPGTVVLRVATKERKFEIAATLLPDNMSYLAVEQFLNLRAQENAATQAGESGR
jgi:hypothetical protein